MKSVFADSNRGWLFSRITASPDAIAEFCKRWQIAELAMFGSVLGDDFNRESDIDVLVEFEPGCVPGIQFVSMASELSRLLGRPVDVLTRSAVERSPNYIRRREILKSAEVIYAARWFLSSRHARCGTQGHQVPRRGSLMSGFPKANCTK